MENMKLITCFVNGKWRKYRVKDTGVPFERKNFEYSAGSQEVGGLCVSRCDPPFSPEKGNGWVGNFPDMETVMNFIRCLRAGSVTVEDVQEVVTC